MLREARESLGRNLADAAIELRIRLAYLESIEAGRLDELPGRTYASGFVRSYANFLGLDANEVVKRFQAASGEGEGQTQLVLLSPVLEGRLPTGSIFFIAGLLAVAAYGSWYYLSQNGEDAGKLIAELPQRFATLLDGDETGAPAESDAQKATTAPAPSASDEDSSLPEVTGGESAPGEEGSLAEVPDPAATAPDVDRESGAASAAASSEESPTTAVAVRATGEGDSQTAAVPSAPGMAAASNTSEGASDSAEETRQASRNSQLSAETPEVSVELVQETAAAAAPPSSESPKPNRKQEAAAAPPDDGDRTVTASPRTTVSADSRDDLVASVSASAVNRVAEPPQAPEVQPKAAPERPGTTDSGRAPHTALASTGNSLPAPNRDRGIVLRAEADSWVEVHESGIEAPIYSRVLRVGETYRVPPQNGLTLATGNAGGLIVLVDGEPTPTLGPSGAVRRGIKLNAARLVAGTAGRD